MNNCIFENMVKKKIGYAAKKIVLLRDSEL